MIMIISIIILVLCNLLLNRYFKNTDVNFGVIKKNLKLVSKVYGHMNTILRLHKADSIAINKISIEDGVILKRMLHEVSKTKEPLINELNTLPIGHKEYGRLKRINELDSYTIYVDEIVLSHEHKTLSNHGIKYLTHIKIIDKLNTAYILTLYYKDYDIKVIKYRKAISILYLKIVNRIFKNNIDTL